MNKYKNNDKKKSKSIVGRKQFKYDSKRKSSNYTEMILSSLGNINIRKILGSGLFQTKLNISQPGDALEHQADTLAEQMVHKDSAETIRGASIAPVQVGDNSAGSVTTETEADINNLKGKGNPLDQPVREYFQARFGIDMGNVRIHTGQAANKLTDSVNARAFTRGNDIVFKESEYNPGTTEGRKLLAHELVHTVQQGANLKKAGSKVTRGDAEPISLPTGTVPSAHAEQPIQRKIAKINGLPENLLKNEALAKVKDIIVNSINKYNDVPKEEGSFEIHINYLRNIKSELEKVKEEIKKNKKSTKEDKALIEQIDNYLENKIKNEFEAVSKQLTEKGELAAFENRDKEDKAEVTNEKPPFAVIKELIKKPDGTLEILGKYGYNWFTALDHLTNMKYVKAVAEYKERTQVMRAMVDYRKKEINSLVEDVINLGLTEINKESEKRNVIPKGSEILGMVGGKVLIKAIIPGSDSLTSDIDITFCCPGKAAFEVTMVKYFNTISRSKFGRPTGTLFDVNAYTSGFMSKESGHGAKKDRESTGEVIRIGNVINKQNETQVVLGILPIREFFGEKRIVEWNRFCEKTIEDLATNLDNLIDEYSSLIQGKPSNATDHLEEIFKEATNLYIKTSDALETEKPKVEKEIEKEKKENKLKGEFSEKDVKLMASNKLYEKELTTVQDLLKKRDNILKRIKNTVNDKDKLKKLRDELVENKKAYDQAQGKALVYSNEAYYNAGAVIHVVKGGQSGEKVKLSSQQLVESILMNIGYKLQHFNEEMKKENGSVSGAVVKTSKYGDRIGEAMKDIGILEKLSQEERKTIELEKEIQKNYKKNEGYNSPAAKEAMAEKKLTEEKFDETEVNDSYIEMASKTLILSYTKPIEDFIKQKNTKK